MLIATDDAAITTASFAAPLPGMSRVPRTRKRPSVQGCDDGFLVLAAAVQRISRPQSVTANEREEGRLIGVPCGSQQRRAVLNRESYRHGVVLMPARLMCTVSLAEELEDRHQY